MRHTHDIKRTIKGLVERSESTAITGTIGSLMFALVLDGERQTDKLVLAHVSWYSDDRRIGQVTKWTPEYRRAYGRERSRQKRKTNPSNYRVP